MYPQSYDHQFYFYLNNQSFICLHFTRHEGLRTNDESETFIFIEHIQNVQRKQTINKTILSAAGTFDITIT